MKIKKFRTLLSTRQRKLLSRTLGVTEPLLPYNGDPQPSSLDPFNLVGLCYPVLVKLLRRNRLPSFLILLLLPPHQALRPEVEGPVVGVGHAMAEAVQGVLWPRRLLATGLGMELLLRLRHLLLVRWHMFILVL